MSNEIHRIRNPNRDTDKRGWTFEARGIGTSLEGSGEVTRNMNSRERVGYIGGVGQTKEAGISTAAWWGGG